MKSAILQNRYTLKQIEMLNRNLYSGYMESLIYGKRFDSATLLLGIFVLVFILCVLRVWKNRKLPPGPVGLPIFGSYFSLRKDPLKALDELAKTYGNVFGLYIGPQYVVFLNDWEAVKDGLGQNTTLDRPPLFEHFPYKFGLGGVNGAEWVEVRRLTSKALKDGLYKNCWEDIIEREMFDTIELIEQQDGKPIEVRGFLRSGFSNNVISLILGKRLDVGHSITETVSRTVDFIMETISTLNVANFSEKLQAFLSVLGLETIPPIIENTKEMFQLCTDAVDSNALNPDSEAEESFISRFQREIDSHKRIKDKTYITEGSLKGTVIGLMIGGSETVRTGIIWALIAMAEHPDKQRKVHEEVDRVIGENGSLRWSERSKVPYTMATLLESMRWKTTEPFPGIRQVSENTRIQGYHIPKGTFVITNTWCLHYDPKYWKNPDQFIPERFLLEDGHKVNMAPDSFNPFSYGKRNCPGKLFALINMFQYFSTLMRKFKVLPKEGDKVKYEELLGLSYQARNVELRFIPR